MCTTVVRSLSTINSCSHAKHWQKQAFTSGVLEDSTEQAPLNWSPSCWSVPKLGTGGGVRWDRKKLPLSLPSPLLVLTNEPLASPNYLARATASSLSSKTRPQPNIRKLPAGSNTKAAGLHIISTTASMNPKLCSPSPPLSTHKMHVGNCSLQSLKVFYWPHSPGFPLKEPGSREK